MWRDGWLALRLVVRSALPLEAGAAAAREAMVAVDPMQPVFHLRLSRLRRQKPG